MALSLARVDRLCGGTCSYVCPQTWLNEARANIGLSPTMGFLNENDSLAYFEILGELSSGLSFTVGLFMTLSFLLLLAGFFRRQGRTYLATPWCLSWLKKRKFWLSALNVKDVPYNGDPRETLGRVHVKYFPPKDAFLSKTVATFVQNVGLIWLKCGFLLQLFRTQM